MVRFDVIDRRQSPQGKNLPNRERFLHRQRTVIKEAVKEVIREGNIGDVVSGKKKIRITKKSTREPTFRLKQQSGRSERVITGNDRYIPGDKIPRPPGGLDGGWEGTPDGEGEDTFEFVITHDEFLEYFFEDLELPDMVKRMFASETDFRWQRAGFSPQGPPPKIDMVRTMRHAVARRFMLRQPKMEEIRRLQEELHYLLEERSCCDGSDRDEFSRRAAEIEEEMRELERRIVSVPFLDTLDVRYRRHEKAPQPMSKAVMFALMDVSGSMGNLEKELAKRFFMLLYAFLRRFYERVDIVFIRHHHEAKEVDEEEFFRSRESGGTVISTAFECMLQIIQERYPRSEYNLYMSYAGDGQTWGMDTIRAVHLLDNELLPILQYCAYVEIHSLTKERSDMWEQLDALKSTHANFAVAEVEKVSDIWPVFHGLFKKKMKGGAYAAAM